MPMIVSAESGTPLFAPCIYASTVVRPTSGSHATIEQALRGVQLLLCFADDRRLQLRERFLSGRFFDTNELDDLVHYAYYPATLKPAKARVANPQHAKVLSRDNARKRGSTAGHNMAVSVNTVAIRLYYVASYMNWLGRDAARVVCRTLEHKQDYLQLLSEFLGQLRARTPSVRSESPRFSLTSEQMARLVEITDPASPDNPWKGDFARNRNRLIILWGLGTGIRRGELLGIRIRQIDFRKNMANIVRRQDDKDDPRKYQPNVKTRERGIGISDQLAVATHNHIVTYRSQIRGARKHDFLFVANQTGSPLSLAALTKIFRTLRDRHPAFRESLTSHVLRHTWNEQFSDVVDRAGLTSDDERRARNHAMGWSDTSTSADYYLKRRIQRQATEASVNIQQRLMEPSKGDANDQ